MPVMQVFTKETSFKSSIVGSFIKDGQNFGAGFGLIHWVLREMIGHHGFRT
jgi:hypothetical protein